MGTSSRKQPPNLAPLPVTDADKNLSLARQAQFKSPMPRQVGRAGIITLSLPMRKQRDRMMGEQFSKNRCSLQLYGTTTIIREGAAQPGTTFPSLLYILAVPCDDFLPIGSCVRKLPALSITGCAFSTLLTYLLVGYRKC